MSATCLTKPHFFQPLIPGFEDKFLIPISFFKYLKGQECHRVKLRSQGGKLWPVEINGRQFSDGWKQFVQDHDLQIGDFLVFRHEGDLVFDVVVFDRSACEREYPAIVPIKEEEAEIQQQQVPIYTRSGKKVGNKKKVKNRLKVKASSSVLEYPYPNCVIKLSTDSIKKSRFYIPMKFARKNGLHGRSCSVILKGEDTNSWGAKLVFRSSVYSENTYIIGAGWVVFRSVHKFKEGDSLMVELIRNGKVPVFKMRKLQVHPEFTWEAMHQDNAQVGSSSPGQSHANTKTFELRKSQLNIPEVAKEYDSSEHLDVKREPTYQHNTQAGSSSPGHPRANTESSELKTNTLKVPEAAKESLSGKKVKNRLEVKASSFVLKHPYPKCVIKLLPDSIKRSRLYIPRKFARKNGIFGRSCSVILKDEDTNCWGAKLVYRSSANIFIIGAGWAAFHSVHKFKAGDSLIVELIKNGQTPVLKIRKHLDVKREPTDQDNAQPSSFHKQHRTALEAKASSSYVNRESFFVAKVTSKTFEKSRQYIPVLFSRRHLHNKQYNEVMLKDQEGRSWLAKLWHSFSNEKVYITYGWKEFSAANKLKPGDSLVFEFIENGKVPVFKMCRFKGFPGKKQESALPHFYVNMQISMNRKSRIKIPRNFAMRHGLDTSKCSAVTIINENGKPWVVSLRLEQKNEVYIACGWIDFVKENGIQGEDVFMLELVKGGTTPEMKYYALKKERDSDQKGIWEDFEDVKPNI